MSSWMANHDLTRCKMTEPKLIEVYCILKHNPNDTKAWKSLRNYPDLPFSVLFNLQISSFNYCVLARLLEQF